MRIFCLNFGNWGFLSVGFSSARVLSCGVFVMDSLSSAHVKFCVWCGPYSPLGFSPAISQFIVSDLMRFGIKSSSLRHNGGK